MKKVISTRKQYVGVTALHGIDGSVSPKFITFRDGRQYDIDKVLAVDTVVTDKFTGRQDIRYSIQIGGRNTYLFEENNGSGKWFVREKITVEVPDDDDTWA